MSKTPSDGGLWRPEDLLPDALIQGLRSADPKARLDAVHELCELMQEPSLNLAIRAVLRGQLKSEQDDAVRAQLDAAIKGIRLPEGEAAASVGQAQADDADSEDVSHEAHSHDLDLLDLEIADESALGPVDEPADEPTAEVGPAPESPPAANGLDLLDLDIADESALGPVDEPGAEAGPAPESPAAADGLDLLDLDIADESALGPVDEPSAQAMPAPESRPAADALEPYDHIADEGSRGFADQPAAGRGPSPLPEPKPQAPRAAVPERRPAPVEESRAAAVFQPQEPTHELPAGLNLVDGLPRYPRRMPRWLEPKRKRNEWVTWVLAGGLALVIVSALGFFFSRQLGPVLAPDEVARRLAGRAGAPGPEPLSHLSDDLGGGVRGPEMIVIPPGRFMMGSPSNDPDRNWDERRHPVEISETFAIGRTEVTFEQYDRFAEATDRPLPESRQGDRGGRPVVQVTWYDAIAYADWLGTRTGARYRLPTEAEWEYAARAGGKVPVNVSDCRPPQEGGEKAGAAPATGSRVDCAEVAALNLDQENPWGLKYMAGNVWEWTCSRYVRSYDGSEKTCAGDASEGEGERLRTIRGGSRRSRPKWLRATSRDSSRPSGRSALLGFRIAREIDQPGASAADGATATADEEDN